MGNATVPDHNTKKRTHKTPAERRTEILRAAGPHFACHGYRCTDVQDIAKTIGVGKGTIYRFFASKEALFLATVEEAVGELRTFVTGAAEQQEDPLDKLRVAVRGYLKFFDQWPEVIELFIQERAEFRRSTTPIYFLYKEADSDDWRILFNQLRAQGRMRDLDSDTAGDFLADLLYGTVVTHRLTGSGRALSERVDEILDVFFHGILTRDHEAT